MNVQKDYEELFGLLNRRKVDYLIVGAYALGFHGHPRYTGDMDIFIRINKRNADRLITVVNEFGFKNIGIQREDFLKKGAIVQLGFPPVRIDFITSIDGLRFGSAWKHKIHGSYGKQKVWYLSKGDLIKNKKASGRARDKYDLEMLETAKIPSKKK